MAGAKPDKAIASPPEMALRREGQTRCRSRRSAGAIIRCRGQSRCV